MCGIVVGVRSRAESSLDAIEPESALPGIEELFRREYEVMYRLAFTMLGSDGDAEEVVQEAFVSIASRWDKLDNPGGYLRVSVVNGGRKRLRSRTRGKAAAAKLRDGSVTGAMVQREYLRDALDGLPDRQRTAVVLTYYSGLDSNEAGELMGCRPATVRSLIRHAFDRLRQEVER